MKLGDKRRKFTHMLALLILHAEQLGYGVAVDDVRRRKSCGYGHPRSAHRVGLAADILLYRKDRSYIRKGVAYEILHNYWDSIGGAARIEKDLGHFSLQHEGVR